MDVSLDNSTVKLNTSNSENGNTENSYFLCEQMKSIWIERTTLKEEDESSKESIEIECTKMVTLGERTYLVMRVAQMSRNNKANKLLKIVDVIAKTHTLYALKKEKNSFKDTQIEIDYDLDENGNLFFDKFDLVAVDRLVFSIYGCRSIFECQLPG